jgi:peptidoglycan hydrolase-like protein with peptidoglycan-binding domain
MRTVRFVASLLMGLALIMGTAAVSQAAPASEQALPRCQQFTTFYSDFLGARVHRTVPTTGYMNGNTSCILKRGDVFPGVFVLQGAINTCHYKIKADAIFGPETEEAVRKIQEKYGLPQDRVYGPVTMRAMSWPWYSANDKFLFCA